MVTSEELTRLGQSLVSICLIEFWPVLLSIDHHAAELIDGEGSSEASDTLLFIDDRSVFVFPFDHDITDEEEGRGEYEEYQGTEKVKPPFDLSFKSIHPIIDIRVVLFHQQFILSIERHTLYDYCLHSPFFILSV